MTATLSVDVIYALHLKPGDLYAGGVEPRSGIPVQPIAAALRIATIRRYDDNGQPMLAMTAEGLEDYPLTPVNANSQVLVIRGA